jgi:parvulin-like peptidyl-prolyl isomerase
VIEVGAKATALSLRSQILGGASFAVLARAHSIDSTTAPEGGVLGCIPDAEFTAPLNKVIAGLTVGRVSSPISFSSDWLLLLVSRREPETSQQLIPSLVTQEQSALNTYFPRLLGSAKVEVDPQYGTWITKGSLARVQANAGPPADVVPNAGANAGPKASG